MKTQLLLAAILVVGCETGPSKPKTHTQVPSLAQSQEITRGLAGKLTDAKDGVGRVRTLRQQIEDKVIMLRDAK